jgi:large subunit ribosomal protein L3
MGYAVMTTPGLLARKIGMTRVVDDSGNMIPVTLLQIENQGITKVLTPEKEGHHGIQVGYYEKPESRLTKPDLTRLRKAGVAENFSKFKEYSLASAAGDQLKVGQRLSIEMFEGLQAVDVTGFTKGRGFTGSIRRWNHKTGRRTHGSHFHRRPGSLGMRTTPGRVIKNKGQPGQWGNEQTTVRNLHVVEINKEANVLALRGSVPGFRDGFVIIKPSTKTAKKATKE